MTLLSNILDFKYVTYCMSVFRAYCPLQRHILSRFRFTLELQESTFFYCDCEFGWHCGTLQQALHTEYVINTKMKLLL